MALRYDGAGTNGHLEIVDSSNNQRLVVDHSGHTGVGVDPAGIGANVAVLNVNGGDYLTLLFVLGMALPTLTILYFKPMDKH